MDRRRVGVVAAIALLLLVAALVGSGAGDDRPSAGPSHESDTPVSGGVDQSAAVGPDGGDATTETATSAATRTDTPEATPTATGETNGDNSSGSTAADRGENSRTTSPDPSDGHQDDGGTGDDSGQPPGPDSGAGGDSLPGAA